jgi:decaprenyl-phosphate phosphoribosyltransferase
MMPPVLRACRPHQWLKNALVFAAPGAAGLLTESRTFWRAVVGFFALTAAASGTYLLNDVADRESDRRHPTKRFRPIAAGTLGVQTAIALGLALLVGSIGLAWWIRGGSLAIVIGCYVALTVSYSLWWKRVAVVDLVAVALGFVLRAVAGAVATDVPLSNWFLICTSFGSLFVVSGKRYAESIRPPSSAGPSVAASHGHLPYEPAFLRVVLGSALSGTMLSYCQWAFEKDHVAGGAHPLYLVSIVPMMTAMLRYLLVVTKGDAGAPEEVFYRDRPLQIFSALWVAVFAVAVYVG